MGEGRRHKTVIPDVVGLTWENACVTLANAGFASPRAHFEESYAPVDEIIAQEPPGGHLTGRDTVATLRVSKQSLVQFLPSAYRERPSAEGRFLRQFLWVFQHIFEGVSRKVDGVHLQLSPRTADEGFLPWLGQWLAVTLDADWPQEKKRRVLLSAAALYRWRGTARAIARLVEIYTDVRPAIVENAWPHEGLRVGVHSTVGVDTVILPSMNLAHCFIVRFPCKAEELGADALARVHQIVQIEKPAHTVYALEFAPDEEPADGDGDAT